MFSACINRWSKAAKSRGPCWSRTCPKKYHHDLDYLVEQLDWKGNTDEHFKDNHYLEPVPVADTQSEGYVDRWIVYGKIDGEQLFTAKELTVDPGAKCTIKDNGAYGLITVQGKGRMNRLNLDCPKLIRFHELTEDEVFCTESAARAGVDLREHQRRGTAGGAALLRPGSQSRRAANRGVQKLSRPSRVCQQETSAVGGAEEKAGRIGLLLKDNAFDRRGPCCRRIGKAAFDDAGGGIEAQGQPGNFRAIDGELAAARRLDAVAEGIRQIAPAENDFQIGQAQQHCIVVRRKGRANDGQGIGEAVGIKFAIGIGPEPHDVGACKTADAAVRQINKAGASVGEINPTHQRSEPAIKRNVERPPAVFGNADGARSDTGIIREHAVQRNHSRRAHVDRPVTVAAGTLRAIVGAAKNQGEFAADW